MTMHWEVIFVVIRRHKGLRGAGGIWYYSHDQFPLFEGEMGTLLP